MKEQELDRLLERQTLSQEGGPSEQKFQKKIRRAVSRTLYTRILAVLLIIAAVSTGLYFGSSAAMNAIFYDPSNETGFLIEDDRGDVEFGFLLEETLSMYFPGIRPQVILNDDWDSYTSTGFSGYDINLKIESAFDPLIIDGASNCIFHIGMSKLDIGRPPLLSHTVSEFLDPLAETPDFLGTASPENELRELNNLPASAILDVSLSFEKYLTSDEVAELIRSYPDTYFQWAALKNQETSYIRNIAGGMSLSNVFGERLAPEFEPRYPNLLLFESKAITGAQLEASLKSTLQLLIDHPDFVKLMSSRPQFFGAEITLPNLKQRLAAAEEEWACYGLRINSTPQDIKALMAQLPITRVIINDVKVSRFQK